jgi:hypothetical protein
MLGFPQLGPGFELFESYVWSRVPGEHDGSGLTREGWRSRARALCARLADISHRRLSQLLCNLRPQDAALHDVARALRP